MLSFFCTVTSNGMNTLMSLCRQLFLCIDDVKSLPYPPYKRKAKCLRCFVFFFFKCKAIVTVDLRD